MTPRQQAFVNEYLIDLNATQAAIRAGYSAKTALQQGSRLLMNVEVAAAVAEQKTKRSERTQVDADWLLTRLADEADADIADLYDENTGQLKPIHQWPMVWRKGLVAGVEVEELFERRGAERVQIGHLRKVKLADRTKVKELIGRHVLIGRNAGDWLNEDGTPGNPELDQGAKTTLINNTQAAFQSFAAFWKKVSGGAADVSDLLAFQSVSSGGSTGSTSTGGSAGYPGGVPGNEYYSPDDNYGYVPGGDRGG